MPKLSRFTYSSLKEGEPRAWLILCKITGEATLRKVLPPKLNPDNEYIALIEGYRVNTSAATHQR